MSQLFGVPPTWGGNSVTSDDALCHQWWHAVSSVQDISEMTYSYFITKLNADNNSITKFLLYDTTHLVSHEIFFNITRHEVMTYNKTESW